MIARLLPAVAVTALIAALVASGCAPPPRPTTGGATAVSTSSAPTGPGNAGRAAPAAKAVEEGTYGDKDGIPVGAYFGLTGADASFGQESVKAMAMALDEIKASGGPSIKLIVHDDRCTAADVPAVLNKLINEDKVVAVVGEVASTRSLQGAPFCQLAKVPMISPSSTNPAVTEKGDYIFRTCFIDPYQGYVMAKFAVDRFQARTAAILYPQANDYSVGLAKFFKEAFEKAGGQIAAEEAYGKDQKDFSAELDHVASTNPDVLFVPCYYQDAGTIAKQARERGLDMPILGGDGWDSDTVYEVGGDATNNCFFSNHYAKDDKSQVVQDFVKRFTDRWGTAPTAMAATAYDAMRILAEAMALAPDPADRAALRDAIAKTKDFKGVTGTITINAQRNAVKDAVVLELKEGVQTYVTTIPAPDKQ